MKLGVTGRIARASAARPWLTIGAWVVGLAIAALAAGSLGDALVQEDKVLTTTESGTADDINTAVRGSDNVPVTETIIVTSDRHTFADTSFQQVIETTRAAITALDGVASVEAPTADAPSPVSADQSTALLTATLSRDHPDGLGAAIVILLIVFGALVAAGLPLLVSIVSIIAAVGATAVVGRAFDLSFFILNMITMMGLALGIDYSLVIVQRFREELAHGRSMTDAVAFAGNTASRAVLISGITVLISLAGLLIVPSTVMVSLGSGAMIVAVFSVISALTLLPAVLRLLGRKVNRGKLPISHPGAEPRMWSAIARGVMRRPGVAAIAGLSVLLALAVPAFSMRLTFAGTDALPNDLPFKQATEVLTTDFGYGQSSTLVVIENAGEARAQVESLSAAIETSDAFAETASSWGAPSRSSRPRAPTTRPTHRRKPPSRTCGQRSSLTTLPAPTRRHT